MVLKGQEESESSSWRNFLSRFCLLQQNVNKAVLLFFSQRPIKEKNIQSQGDLYSWSGGRSPSEKSPQCPTMSTSICAPSFLRRIVVKNDDGVAQQYSQYIHQLSLNSHVSFKLKIFQDRFCDTNCFHYKFHSKFTLHMQLSYWVFHND